MTVTCVREAPAELVARFWPLYEEAFGPLRTQAAARQVLTVHEFAEEFSDARVWKYLAWDEAGRPIGMTTLTDDLDSIPWISADYYAARYPRQWARRGVFYLGFTLADPTLGNARIFWSLLKACTLRVAEREGICAWDICGHNDASIGFGAGIARMLPRLADFEVAEIDKQTYYAAHFGGVDRALDGQD